MKNVYYNVFQAQWGTPMFSGIRMLKVGSWDAEIGNVVGHNLKMQLNYLVNFSKMRKFEIWQMGGFNVEIQYFDECQNKIVGTWVGFGQKFSITCLVLNAKCC